MNVSVICPVFDTPAAVLAAAIRSVLNQAGPHTIELILVNDCSTNPATVAALRDAVDVDGRVRVLNQDKNTGPAQARSLGVAHATYDWIGFIDSDDLWPEGKLDQAAVVMEEWPDTQWISGSFATLLPGDVLRPSQKLTAKCPPTVNGRTAQRLCTPGSTRALVGYWHPLGTSLFRRHLIAAAGDFDPRLTYGEDWLLCLRISLLTPMEYIEAETYVLRRQGASLMRSPRRLSAEALHGIRTGRRDPALRFARSELRWLVYGGYKEVAMNNILNGSKLRGLVFALRALLVDPRQVKELLMFLRLLQTTGPELASGLQFYSNAEQLDFSDTNNLE